jgi:hypothetical protein
VKTTPNPNATKKSRGELGPLLPLPFPVVAADEVAAAAVEVGEVIVNACDAKTTESYEV